MRKLHVNEVSLLMARGRPLVQPIQSFNGDPDGIPGVSRRP